MSDAEEAEYEVESVVAARVETASRSKRSKLVWKFLVRWKGYSPDDDTWEPYESFNGSEHIVEAFWNRCTTHGRDISDMSLFKAGEEFRPVGPPRHKPKPKSTGNGTAQTIRLSEEPSNQPSASNVDSSSASARKRRLESSDIIEISDRSPKRVKENITKPPPSASSSKLSPVHSTRSKAISTPTSIPSIPRKERRFRKPSPSEIVPDSDEERNNILRMPRIDVKHAAPKPSSSSAKAKTPPRQQSPIVIEDDSPPKVTNVGPAHSAEDDSSRKLPAHRARLANPRVKMVDISETLPMEALPKKTRGTRRAATDALPVVSTPLPTRPIRSRPGPGRSSTGLMQEKSVSSLLVGDKSSLKTLKGKYVKPPTAPVAGSSKTGAVDSMDVDVDVEPPSAEELLRLAGLDSNAAEVLSDFEENDVDPNDATTTNLPKTPQAKDEVAAESTTSDEGKDTEEQRKRKESLEQAKNNLFPDPRPSAPATSDTNWGRSTIFGPLALGSDVEKEQSNTSRLLLNLDASVAIPTSVAEASQSVRKSLNATMDDKQVPGKFYGAEAALSLLETVRASGESATIVIREDATDERKKHFRLFLKRLEDGDIFVCMVGSQIVVFSSSSNTLLSSRLNTPATFLNQPGKVILSRVDVENPSGFADATANADPRRWSQYLATIEK